MFKRCVFTRCFCNGKISGLGVESRTDWLEQAWILRVEKLRICAEMPRLKQIFPEILKQHHSQIKEGLA
jgi:hypothetical protein